MNSSLILWSDWLIQWLEHFFRSLSKHLWSNGSIELNIQYWSWRDIVWSFHWFLLLICNLPLHKQIPNSFFFSHWLCKYFHSFTLIHAFSFFNCIIHSFACVFYWNFDTFKRRWFLCMFMSFYSFFIFFWLDVLIIYSYTQSLRLLHRFLWTSYTLSAFSWLLLLLFYIFFPLQVLYCTILCINTYL